MSPWSRNRQNLKLLVLIDETTSRELGMRFRACCLIRMATLGPSAMSQIRLQRVRGLDRVLRGRLHGPIGLEMRNPENTRRHGLIDL